MIDKLRSMAVFVKVAEAGSFRAAAERLSLSASVVSHHISQLEKELDVQLLYRSTRHVALTDPGQRFYESCRSMVESAEAALAEMDDDEPCGRLRVLLPAPFAGGPFMHLIAHFCQLYPRVDVELDFDDKLRNLIQERFDVAITIGALENSSLICRTLFSRAHGIFASPAYLEGFGSIDTMDDLERAAWIITPPNQPQVFTLGNGEQRTITPRVRISANNLIAKYQLALSGMGVVRIPPIFADQDVAQGRLVAILPEWQTERVSCYAVYPARAKPQSLARRFVDVLINQWSTVQEDAVKQDNGIR